MSARLVRAAELRLHDALDRLRGRHDPLVPPRRLDFVGPSDFRATGEEFLGHFVRLAGLRPDERVLDVGCGIGRMARPLAGYLRPPGGYDGFDIVPAGIAWCAHAYTSGHPHFAFHLADVRNALYRPDAGVEAREYRFPFVDAAFDFAFATSLFTHLLPDAADRYLAELGRVVRPGGRVLLTFFLLDADARRRQDAGEGDLAFTEALGPARAVAGPRPEDALAYDERWIRERLDFHELDLREPVRRGSWSGRPDGLSLQDIVVADRRRHAPTASPSSVRSSRAATPT
jgi:SAM-dependent methyltransferase